MGTWVDVVGKVFDQYRVVTGSTGYDTGHHTWYLWVLPAQH